MSTNNTNTNDCKLHMEANRVKLNLKCNPGDQLPIGAYIDFHDTSGGPDLSSYDQALIFYNGKQGGMFYKGDDLHDVGAMHYLGTLRHERDDCTVCMIKDVMQLNVINQATDLTDFRYYVNHLYYRWEPAQSHVNETIVFELSGPGEVNQMFEFDIGM